MIQSESQSSDDLCADLSEEQLRGRLEKMRKASAQNDVDAAFEQGAAAEAAAARAKDLTGNGVVCVIVDLDTIFVLLFSGD